MAALVVVLLVALASFGCSRGPDVKEEARRLTGGDPDRGVTAINNYGCGSCHTIPGIADAVATVGPPLTGIARRTYLGGHVQNTPAGMMRWIQKPQEIDKGTAMPDLGVTEQDARDIVAYLYTLR